MSVVSYRGASPLGVTRALRQVRDPLLLLVVPSVFAMLLFRFGYLQSWPIGFDFRGTLWEPARAILEGSTIYPEPRPEAVVGGNPAVYPPVLVLASVPLALLPVTLAALVWLCLLGLCVLAALRVVGVRDWRCHVLALTSPVVVHGLFYGNLTVALVLALALAWRYRDERPAVAGIAVGVAVAAKIFVWPLLVWLLLTRRYRASAWAAAAATALVLGAWAVIGFEGIRDYPALLRVVQDVYAVRSVSASTAVAALGVPTTVAVAAAATLGLALLALAFLVVRRPDGDRRAFALVVGGCIVASPIVWPNYLALLIVPIAITWRTLAPMWWFGYVSWALAVASPKPDASSVCCAPGDVTAQAWASTHTEPTFLYAAGSMALALAVVALVTRATRDRHARMVTVADP